MANWKSKLPIKHLLTEDESPEAVEKFCNAVADIVENDRRFRGFSERDNFRHNADMDEANALLSELYDYCDRQLIWVE